jgi:hypothetical protein
MSLVTVASLEGFLGISYTGTFAEVLDLAEALIAAEIGAEKLAEETGVVETVTMVRDRSTFHVASGPIASVTSVTVDGSAVAAGDITFNKWMVGLAGGAGRAAVVVVTYVTGFASEATLPPRIKNAVLAQAKALRGGGGGALLSERIGDYAATFSPESLAVVEVAVLLVAPWKRPTY